MAVSVGDDVDAGDLLCLIKVSRTQGIGDLLTVREPVFLL